MQAVFVGGDPTLQNHNQQGETRSEDGNGNGNGNGGGRKREFPPCLCDEKHQWKECLYIMDFLRPRNWKIDEAILQKVQEALADNDKVFRRNNIKHVYKRTHDEWQKNKGGKSSRTNGKGPRTNEGGNQLPANFATINCTKRKVHSTKSTKKIPMSFATHNATTTRTNKNNPQTIKGNAHFENQKHIDNWPKQHTDVLRRYKDPKSSSYLTHKEEKYVKYGLAKSTILNSRSTIHICNNRSRIYDYVKQKGSMLTGKAECQILGYGKVRLTLSEPRGVKEIILHNVAYIPGFLTNIASLDQMNAKNVHWDSRTRELYHKNGVLCYTPRHFRQTVLQYVPIDATFFVQMENDLREMEDKNIQVATSTWNDPLKEEALVQEASLTKEESFVRKVQASYEPTDASYEHIGASYKPHTTLFSSRRARVLKGTLQEWHERMGHLNHHAVAKLQQAQGVEITNKEFDENCETCRLAKAQRIISRILTTRSTIPYEKIYFDLIPIYEGYIFHISYDALGMNHL
jgi:hypothetical protein